MNDLIQAMKLKIKQTIRESKISDLIFGLGMVLFFGLGLLSGLFSWMEEHRFFAWMGGHLTLVIGLVILFFLYMTIAMILRHRRWMRQHDIDILNADVSKMDDEATRRAEKYRDQ
jgi:uncharacterized BrkB/YihY/UPF0761 family membrane protein